MFWEKEGREGGTPYARAQGELQRFKLDHFDFRVGLVLCYTPSCVVCVHAIIFIIIIS